MLEDIKVYPYKVEIPWRKGDTVHSWDLVCIQAIEKYGMPGYKYRTQVTMDSLTFYFKDESDALWFSLSNE